MTRLIKLASRLVTRTAIPTIRSGLKSPFCAQRAQNGLFKQGS
jgi:hypothetical protein